MGKAALVVDDDVTVRKVLCEILTIDSNVVEKCEECENAKEAISILKNNPSIEVVVTDEKMPGMSGLELIEFIQSNFPEISVILVSGYLSEQDKIRATNNPVVKKIFLKPFAVSEIADVVREL